MRCSSAGRRWKPNGSCWQVPLLGGELDKVFASPDTLTVQKLGVLYDAHPALALPDWTSYTTLTIPTSAGIVFAGGHEYEDFLFPANGDYKAELTVWRLPQGRCLTQFEGGSTGQLRKNLGLEHPAKPTGWYSYSFRFHPAGQRGGGAFRRAAGAGRYGGACHHRHDRRDRSRCGDRPGQRAVRPAGQRLARLYPGRLQRFGRRHDGQRYRQRRDHDATDRLPKDFGTVEVEAEEPAPRAANASSATPSGPCTSSPRKAVERRLLPPAEDSMTLVDFGQVKVTTASRAAAPTPPRLYTIPGAPCRAPPDGVVVFAGIWPSPATPWSSTTAAGCAGDSRTACR